MYLLSEHISSEVIQVSQRRRYFGYKINFLGESFSQKVIAFRGPFFLPVSFGRVSEFGKP
jgi:hypothetical protein